MTDFKQKIGQHFFTGLRMNDFGMKLQAVKMSLHILCGRNFRIRSRSGNGKTFRQCADGITVTHPALSLFLHAGEHAFLFFDK